MRLRHRTTVLALAGLLALGTSACDGGEVDTPDADGADNGVQPDDEGPESNGTLDDS